MSKVEKIYKMERGCLCFKSTLRDWSDAESSSVILIVLVGMFCLVKCRRLRKFGIVRSLFQRWAKVV
jgi:hypothetical protein